MSSLRDRAAAGAAFLDRVKPDWFKRVNLDTLDLSCDDTCVLGQLHGDYLRGMDKYGLDNERARELGLWGNCHPREFLAGFRGGWNRLTRAWKNEIENRLHPQAVAA